MIRFTLILIFSLSSTSLGSILFADEFSGSTLKPEWTSSRFWWNGDGYHQADHVYRNDAIAFVGGNLALTLRHESAVSWQGDPVEYVSGLIQTGGVQGVSQVGFSYLYGYAEARIKVPNGSGVFPAFWMLPASYHDDEGEIDAMEHIGQEPRNAYSFVRRHGLIGGGSWESPVDLSQTWHIYGLDWQPSRLNFYVDGILARTITDQAIIPTEPEYLLLNLQTGGTWAGFPDNAHLPVTMLVDYVRVYNNSVPEPNGVGVGVALFALVLGKRFSH